MATLAPMKQKLSNDDKGQYLVTTATGSQYLLDMKARTVHRTMAATAPLNDFLAAGFSKLRRDGETLDLHVIEHCVVGESARYYIQVREDHIVTLRMTSPVVRTDELEVAESE
jgi:hypothetical protein